jgi:hypothetical protein
VLCGSTRRRASRSCDCCSRSALKRRSVITDRAHHAGEKQRQLELAFEQA